MSAWIQRGAMVGGAVAAAVSIPEALALGAVAYSPLGPGGAAIGALAGLLTLVVHNLVSGFVRGVRPMTAGVYSLTSLMIASTVTASGREGSDAMAAIVGMSLGAGALQTLFGALRLGVLVKYIPYPVVSGLVNGTALLILIGYVPQALGAHTFDEMTDIEAWRAGPIAVAATVVGVSLIARRWPRVPGPVVGLLAGTAVYWLGRGAGVDMGVVLASETSAHASTVLLENLMDPGPIAAAAIELSPFALGIAAMASLRSLIVTVAVDREVTSASIPNRELIAQGIGNLISGLVGGLPAAGYGSASMAAIQAGGRTRAVRLWTGLAAAIALLLITPLAATVPMVALGAMLVAYAVRTLDPWSLKLIARAARHPSEARYSGIDLVIVVAVAAILVGWGIFEAVVIGLAIALASFVVRMSRPPLRRTYRAGRVRSYVQRPAAEIAALEDLGQGISVFELQGALFFGAADHVASRVDAALAGARSILLDLERVNDLDSTGAHVILGIARACDAKGATLHLSGLAGQRVLAPLESAGVLERARVHATLDAALAAAEDALLDEKCGPDRYYRDIEPAAIDALGFLSEPGDIVAFVEAVELEAGAMLFAQGDPGDSLYFLRRGRIDLQLDAGERPVQIAVLCPGTVLGEMALLDGKPRAASAVAERAVHAWRLSADEFQRMRRERPDLAAGLMEGLAAELAKRVRIANRHATELRA